MQMLLTLTAIFVYTFFRYIFLSIGFFLVTTKLFPSWTKAQKILKIPYESKKLRHDLIYSFFQICIVAIIYSLLSHEAISKYFKVYSNIEDYGYPWLFVSFLIYVIVHDTYFFWTHVCFHKFKIFYKIHSIHHYSTDPTSLTTFSFHPIEAIFQVIWLPILFTMVPLHSGAILAMVLFTQFQNITAHSGLRLFQFPTRMHWLFRFAVLPIHHHTHHHNGNVNFGLYFRFWDIVMKTSEDYESSKPKLDSCG